MVAREFGQKAYDRDCLKSSRLSGFINRVYLPAQLRLRITRNQVGGSRTGVEDLTMVTVRPSALEPSPEPGPAAPVGPEGGAVCSGGERRK